MKFLIPTIALLLSALSVNCREQARGNNWDQLLMELFQKENGSIRLVREEDLAVYLGYGITRAVSERIYGDNLRAFKEGRSLVYLEYDINQNKEKEVLLVCVDPANKRYYLVILEKSDGKFVLIKYFKYDSLFFISGAAPARITLGFQVGTDWIKTIVWNGHKYSEQEDDKFEP